MLVSFEFCFFNIALQLQMEEPCILSLAWISFTLGWVRKRLLVEWKKKVYLVLSWTFIFKWRNQIELFYTIEKAFLANQELSSNPLQSGGKTQPARVGGWSSNLSSQPEIIMIRS